MNSVRSKTLRQRGFSFVEVLVAVAVLALCAVPLADAVRNGIAASSIGTAKARELRCMKSMMETVLAEPYPNLANAALGKDVPSSYSRPADGSCRVRNVYIAKAEWEYGKTLVFLDNTTASWRLESALLYITISSPTGTYSFTTLVSR